ncbi:hypothetical protein BJ875DRAFT_448966 [Amylocarpus encephaloides]|uniref:Uncharacterized protein n=1 Tax=Amylocarpus encephaloides TaxID=45428 RepID=A0A9P7YU46_9HELO|nr:hypothetical protein BJ875DRAFT_448966 [Amylocarpus encephaloides]
MPSSHTQTPREYQVYNDDLSPDSQPQTPAHLPESRHRSRYHSSFTAPTNRHSRRWRHWLTNNHDGAGADLSEARIETVLATPSRRTRGGRSGSPTGMQSEGFQGLYGGRENGDDEQSWVDGVRVDNAEARLFSPAAIGNDNERSLDDTPEREDWRSHLR